MCPNRAIRARSCRYALGCYVLRADEAYWGVRVRDIRLDEGLVGVVRAGCDEAAAAVGAFGAGSGGVAGDVIAQWGECLDDLGVRVREIPAGVAVAAASFSVVDESVGKPFGTVTW